MLKTGMYGGPPFAEPPCDKKKKGGEGWGGCNRGGDGEVVNVRVIDGG